MSTQPNPGLINCGLENFKEDGTMAVVDIETCHRGEIRTVSELMKPFV